LYFGSLSLMLLGVINKKNVDQMDILYFEFPIAIVNRDNVVFTDASANTNPPPNFYSDPNDLDKLNWNEIDSLKWSSTNDTLRHQRMAEVLVHNHLPMLDAQRVIVWNDWVKERVKEIVNKSGVKFPQIELGSRGRHHYFLNFMAGKRTSIVTGPRVISWEYQAACKQIEEGAGRSEDAPFNTPKKLLEALRNGLECLPQTEELVGLFSDNCVHMGTVGDHTLQVVERLKSQQEFQDLPPEYQDRIELAAYLHDIGKGPKSRWSNNGGIQKVDPDHAVRALHMMVEILTVYVKKVTQKNAELILKLVCYHDLVGEVLGKGRDEQQIIDVAKNELELDMLFAMGKADVTSLVKLWWDDDEAAELHGRCLAAIRTREDL